MENSEKYFDDLKEFYINSRYIFVLNTKETMFFHIDPQVIDNLCGFNFKSETKKERIRKLEKRKDKILNGVELYKYSLIKSTNYFAGYNLLFVVFNPDLTDYYADFVFSGKNKGMIALRTKLPFIPTTYNSQMVYMDTQLVLDDVFNVTSLDELLCGKTIAYPLEYKTIKSYKKHSKKDCNEIENKLIKMIGAYEATFDVSKNARLDNFKKGKLKALQ